METAKQKRGIDKWRAKDCNTLAKWNQELVHWCNLKNLGEAP